MIPWRSAHALLVLTGLVNACALTGSDKSRPAASSSGAGPVAGDTSAGTAGAGTAGSVASGGADTAGSGGAAASGGSSDLDGGVAGSAGTGVAGGGAGGADSAGAGGAGGGGTGGGPDSSRLLTSLTPSEQDALCQEIDGYLNMPDVLNQQHELDCRSAGFYATAGSMPSSQPAARAMCQTIHDSCLMGEGPTQIANCGVVGSSCTATVGDLLACWQSTPAQLALALAQLPSCDMVTLADLAMPMRPPVPPSAECQTLDQKCPGAMMAPSGQ